MKFPMLAHDKANHALYGSLIYTVGSLMATHFATPALLTGLVAVLAAAVGKEIYDKVSEKGTPDPWDAAWTILGAVPPMVIDFVANNKVLG